AAANRLCVLDLGRWLIRNCYQRSCPALSRVFTSFCLSKNKVVDGWDKPGDNRRTTAHPLKTTDICWPPRRMVIRHCRPPALVTRSRSAGLSIFWLLTVITTSPLWKPTDCAAEPSATSVMTTPSVCPSRRSSSAKAGDRFATVAPLNGERVLICTSWRGV